MTQTSLDDFVPEARTVKTRDGDVAVLPLRMRQLPGFTRAVTPVAPYLLADQMMLAVQNHYDSLREAVVIATNTAPDWLDELWPDDFIAIAAAVVEVNADFFARRVLPAIRTASEAVTRAISEAKAQAQVPGQEQTGQPPLPSLHSADTGSTSAST
jgi:hypothetical protein